MPNSPHFQWNSMELSDIALSGSYHRGRVKLVPEEDRETLFTVRNAGY